MGLSEKDLLLLDCFMYTSESVKHTPCDLEALLSTYTNSDGKVTAEALSGLNFSGDMNAEKMADVMNQMLESEALMDLTIEASIDDGIRGACFVNKNTNEATIAFRGTGGSYGQWYDNLEGYGELSTEAQRKAAAFVENLPYDNMTVTGHSKGGNLAMYVTIVCPDKIDRCLSYEGQGFSKEFCDTYAEEIEDAKRKGKITSISASNDPVHGLLIPIAAEERFVHSNSWPVSHGAYSILTADKNSFDENGNFTPSSYCEEAGIVEAFGLFTEGLSEISNVPIIGSAVEFVADIVGVAAGLFFDQEWDEAWKTVKKAWKDFKKNLKEDVIEILDSIIKTVEKFSEQLKKLTSGYKYASQNPQIVVDTYKLTTYAQRILKVQKRIKTLDERLDSLYWKVGFLDLWDLMQADLLTGYSWRLASCANYLNDTASDFDAVEKDLQNKLG